MSKTMNRTPSTIRAELEQGGAWLEEAELFLQDKGFDPQLIRGFALNVAVATLQQERRRVNSPFQTTVDQPETWGDIESPAMFKEQAIALSLTKAELKAMGFSIVLAGHRAGKNVMGWGLLADLRPKYVVLKSVYPDYQQEAIPKECERITAGQAKNITDKSKVLAIFDDAMWHHSYDQFCKLREWGVPVIVLTSLGPTDKAKWLAEPHRRYATWELNPRVTQEDLQHHKEEDPVAFARDFECKDVSI